MAHQTGSNRGCNPSASQILRESRRSGRPVRDCGPEEAGSGRMARPQRPGYAARLRLGSGPLRLSGSVRIAHGLLLDSAGTLVDKSRILLSWSHGRTEIEGLEAQQCLPTGPGGSPDIAQP